MMKTFKTKDWEAVLNALQEAVFICDQEQNILWANSRLEELLGKNKNDLVGKKCFKLFHAKETPIEHCPAPKSRLEEVPQFLEVWEPHLNKHLAISVNCFCQGPKKNCYMVHTVVDLTAAKKREKELLSQLSQLEEISQGIKTLEQMKSDFVSMVSHELRTPMTVIKEASTLLLTKDIEPEKHQEYLNMICKHVNRLSRLISDLLDLSRIGTGKLVLKQEPLDVVRLLEKLTGIIFPVFKEKEIVFVQSIEKKLPLVVGDKERFLQVMANLIGNAIKYTPKGGEINLAITKEGSSLLFKVTDNGRGLSPEQLRHVFDSFYIGDEILTRSSGGTGLGLTISKGLVEVMGGSIWGESAGVGKGTTFVFSLPIAGKNG